MCDGINTLKKTLYYRFTDESISKRGFENRLRFDGGYCLKFGVFLFWDTVYILGWWFNAVVALFVARTKLLNVEPG